MAKNDVGGVCRMYGVEERFWWGNMRERDHLEDPDVDGKIILIWIFRKWDVEALTGSSWLRIGTGGRHLWMR
jgi:hypothetical protein